jgi:hypothetical protein
MENDIELGTFDIERFGESLEQAAREHVKWEKRKLQWILEEKKAESEHKAA